MFKEPKRDKEALEDEQEWEEVNTHRPEGMRDFVSCYQVRAAAMGAMMLFGGTTLLPNCSPAG